MKHSLRTFTAFIFLLSCTGLRAEDRTGDIISSLRDIATRLGWSQEIFASVKGPHEDFQIFGVADTPFSDLNTASEKAYIQWLLAEHQWPLQNALKKHLKAYKRLGFEIVPLEGIGDEAYRAFLLSYVCEGDQLVLSRSQDAVELLFKTEFLTLKDERQKPNADVWAIFEEVVHQSLKDHFIQRLPKKIPAEPDVKGPYKKFSEKISVEDLLPEKKELAQNGSEWKSTDDFSKTSRGEILVKGKTYQRIKKEKEKSAPSIQVMIYAYPSFAQAQSALRLYRKKLRDLFVNTPDKKGFRISKQEKTHFVFVQGIFMVDLEVTWVEASQEEQKKVVEQSASLIQGKISKVFMR